jgi:hypothetical protein
MKAQQARISALETTIAAQAAALQQPVQPS